jgi:UDP-2-acetamido-2,6-beta-L-arabino-hexul-4-ose reductase
MKIVITGAGGFLGRHLQVRLRAAGFGDVIAVPRCAFRDEVSLAEAVERADAIVHLAGINRAEPALVETGNRELAERLTGALDLLDEAPLVMFANSVQRANDTPYGRGKQEAANVLATWADKRGALFVDIVYQNLFGESGRPDYNSFVATFCHRLARGLRPEIHMDQSMQLIHAQDAAQVAMNHLQHAPASTTVQTQGVSTCVSKVLTRLQDIAEIYDRGRIPDLADPFSLQLFNTYRSFLYPGFYPFSLAAKSDDRGVFVETVQSVGGESQVSISTTRPGVTRGNHFHLRKVERFVVVKGRARIAIRPVFGAEVHVFEVSDEQPAFIDMPTLHTHNITNIGHNELCTMFWVNEIYDPADPDTFIEPVE